MGSTEALNMTGRETQELLATFSAMAPLLTKCSPAPREEERDPKKAKTQHRPQKEEQKIDLPQVVMQMAKLLIRMDADQNLLRKQDSFVFYMQMEPESVIHVLSARAKQWHHEMAQEPQMKTQDWKPLRLTLMQTLAVTMQQRLQKLYGCKPADQLYQTAMSHNLLNAQGEFFFQRWDPASQQLTPNHSGANCNGEDEEVHGTIGGDNSRPGQHHQVPLLVGNGGAECHPMALADLSALRVADATGDPGREQSVESAGSGTQTAQPQSELTGAAAESHVGEGQECWQGQSSQEMRTATSFDRKAVQYALSQLVLHNDRNHCYINAAMAATLWAFLSRSDFQPCHLGPHATLIADCILNHAGTPVTLAAQSWFQEVMQQWPQQHNQGDPVEFLSHVFRGLGLDSFDMKWERRVQIHDTARLMDQSDALRPLTVQFDLMELENSQYGYTALQTLLDSWETQYGMQTALTANTPLICIHVDCYIHQGSSAAVKCERPIHFRGGINLPVFVDQGIQVQRKGYQLLSAIAHSGSDEAGHCRALLKTWPTVQPSPVSFLVVDDDQPPLRIWAEPEWFKRDVNCFWFCDCDVLDLFCMPDEPDTPSVSMPSHPPALEQDAMPKPKQ